ncbi:amidase [Cognaticolwellia beringensis]|uniref:Amidase n=1 Tax=Cognaticolwellia beringensis TaxID=1967665 RepID=A0A222G3G4_9GAMM|nr:amidase [Cognaticolwellia beringensis]ASP46468.1 amidase [Cognaticolwellia beringensis]
MKNVLRFIALLLLYPLSAYSQNNMIFQDLTVIKAHNMMADKQLTSETLVNYYLDRIARIDAKGPQLNSVVQLNKNAIKRAQELDVIYKKSGKVGALHGIPVLLKDNIDTIDGMANTAGSWALKNNYPKDDAFLVQLLKNAGAIILGKTNLSEWANFRSTSSSSGWSGLWGQSKNPYDITTSPCGSSAGSGVAIAADLALLAVGTETDGSVTCPSAINGIVGIKPTLGTISRDGIIPIAHSQDTAGPMARSVTDAVMLLSALTAVDADDNAALAAPADYMSHLKLDGIKGKRIGVARNLMGYHGQLDAVFEQAIVDLQAQGAIIVDSTNFTNSAVWGDAEFEVLLYEFKHGLNAYLAGTDDHTPKSLEALIAFNLAHADKEMPYFKQEIFEMAQAKGPLTDDRYLAALQLAKKSTQAEGIDALLAKHKLDLIIAPTTGPAWKTDWINGDHYLGAASSAAAISGYPHITVPMGYVHGLPVGLSMFSGKLQEGKLIEVAYGYEQSTLHRKSPVL